MLNPGMFNFPMQNMQNQNIILNQAQINELIKPYQDEIEQLHEKLKKKDLEITQLKARLMQNNNSNINNQQYFINNPNNPVPMDILNNNFNPIINQPNQNNFNNNIGNPMNVMNNPMFMNMMMPKEKFKNLNIKVKFEDGRHILVQCNSNDKLETPLNSFENKIGNKDFYDYYIISEKKLDINSTVEENGINGKSEYILAKKKSSNVIKENQNFNKNKNNNLNENKILLNNFNQEVLEDKLNIMFNTSSGLKIQLSLGGNQTIKDAMIKFCSKVGIDSSCIDENLIFLYEGERLRTDDKRTLKKLHLNSGIITVIDTKDIIGA